MLSLGPPVMHYELVKNLQSGMYRDTGTATSH